MQHSPGIRSAPIPRDSAALVSTGNDWQHWATRTGAGAAEVTAGAGATYSSKGAGAMQVAARCAGAAYDDDDDVCFVTLGPPDPCAMRCR